MAALIHGKRIGNVGFDLETIGPTSTLYGDEAVVEALLKSISDTYNFELPTITLQGCSLDVKKRVTVLVLMLIKEICIIVPNEINRDPSGGIVITRKLRASVEEIHALGIVTDSQAGVILGRKEIRQHILLVSANAAQAAMRYFENLDSTPAIRYLPSPPRAAPVVKPAVVIEPYRRSKWNHDLCAFCSKPSTCLLGTCFPCILHWMAWNAATGNNCVGCICGSITCIPIVYNTSLACLRCKGSCCQDCMTAYFCACCSLIQVADELEVCGAIERD